VKRLIGDLIATARFYLLWDALRFGGDNGAFQLTISRDHGQVAGPGRQSPRKAHRPWPRPNCECEGDFSL